jgi:dTDP-4-amino-4,6-dideoxygalactose transaminase
MERIALSEVYVDDEIKRKVLEVIDSGRYILNERCLEFEKQFSLYIGRDYGVLANSATSVMQLTLMALGIGRGHEVIVPSHTAFPTIEPIFHAGAKPVFVDIDDYYGIDADLIEERITNRTRAIIPVHLYGNPADILRIIQIAGSHGLAVLEDSSQAHGAAHGDRRVGAFGQASFFSFYPSKNMTFMGDGGIVITDDKKLARRVSMLRDHGRAEKCVHRFIGFNMRANEIQAAVGLVQLKYLEEFNLRRREIARLYDERLGDLPVTLPAARPGALHVYHMYVIRTEKRDELARYLHQQGIDTGIHYPVPCHMQPAVKKKLGLCSLPATERACREILSLPIHPRLTDERAHRVASAIRDFFKGR